MLVRKYLVYIFNIPVTNCIKYLYCLFFIGLIVEPPLPLPNKIDNANVIVDSNAEEKIDSSSKPQSTECKDDKPLAANE